METTVKSRPDSTQHRDLHHVTVNIVQLTVHTTLDTYVKVFCKG